ncbi:MAG TPA: SDR family NAD(P)-dependent oxidoreductase [Verrucomicrobiae bacterium]|nr:SDR family NAD(P)-dependent oxidoreductase [Verrucomicrobiae bacterium]
MKDFKDKVAAITGAGSGMGRELAIELARRGCHVAVSDINEAALAETAKLVEAFGVRVTSQKLDVANRAGVYAWADQVVKDHGKANLIFNNAGVGLGSTVDSTAYEDFEWIMGINFWGVVYGTKAFLPHLKTSGDGHIINTSSLFGLIAFPMNSCYNASKFAVRGFTECLRQELDMFPCGVSATCVHPGGIKTNIARAARRDPALSAKLGIDSEQATREFEKQFITTANKAAQIIIGAVEDNRRRVLVGPDAKVVEMLQRLMPEGYQKIVVNISKKKLTASKAALTAQSSGS